MGAILNTPKRNNGSIGNSYAVFGPFSPAFRQNEKCLETLVRRCTDVGFRKLHAILASQNYLKRCYDPAAAPRPAMDTPKLFLSYSSVDRSSVVAVQKLLQARSITTFLDRDRLVPGLPWPQALEEGLRGVRAVAVFIGRELGGWQKREMWFALDRQVREEKQGRSFPVIPVLLAGADLTPCFLFLNTWIDLRSLGGVVSAETLDAFE